MLGKFASGKRNTAMGNLVYIHFLQQHYNQSGLQEIEKPFDKVAFLNEGEGKAVSLAKNDYKNALLSKFSPADAAVLGLVTQQGSQKLLDSLNEAFGMALLDALNFDRGEAHRIYQEDLGPLNKLAETVIPTIRDSIENLQNKFIKPIIDIIEAMEKSSKNTAFSVFLNEALEKAKISGKSAIGSKELLENFLEQLNSSDGFVVTHSEYEKGLEYFKTIMTKVHDFVRDTSKTGINDAFKLTNSISQTLQQDLFSTEMGQITAVKRDALINAGLNQVNTALNYVFTGKKQTQNKHYEHNKNTFKTDITIPGKYITLKIEDKEKELSVSLQASVKFLKTQAWTLKGGAIDVNSGSGGSLLEFFDAMNYNQKQRYDIYNYLTFVGLSQPFARIMMQRQLFRLFSTGSDSSAGQKIDFSTHILANGELISMWELFKFINKFKDTTELFKQYINFYLQRNLKKTKKLTSRQNVGKTRIKINENWMFLNQWYQGSSKKRVRGSAALKRKDIGAAWYRARVVFNDINAAVINATLHLHKIAQQWATISRTEKEQTE